MIKITFTLTLISRTNKDANLKIVEIERTNR